MGQALQRLTDLIQNGEFRAVIGGEVVQPDPQSVEGDGWISCPEGMVDSPSGVCGESLSSPVCNKTDVNCGYFLVALA